MNYKLLITLFLICLVTFTLVSCGKTEITAEWLEWVGDGAAYTEEDNLDETEEDIEEITVFKNDWENFNNARTANSPVYQKLKSVIGCDINADNGSAAGWESQEVLLQAAGELPDIFLTNGPDNSYLFNSLIENGDILPISDWVSEEHYPNIYNYLKQFDYMRDNISYSYGKLWYIPSTWHNEKSLYVRTDWIRNLNAKLDDILVAEKIVNSKSEITDEIRSQYEYKVPTTLVEFYRLARAFTKYDPDNNGKNDTYGYYSESNKDMDSFIYIAYNAGWNQWMEQEDGTYLPTDVCDGSMNATYFIARMIKEGYMSIDSLNSDMDGKQNKIMTSKSGMIIAHNWYQNFATGLLENYESWTREDVINNLAMVEVPAGPTGTYGIHGDDVSWQGFCINRNMSNARIRKCLEFYDYLLSDEGYKLLQYGVEGVHYTTNEDGSFKESLIPADSVTGQTPQIQYYDFATQLYALVDWTMQYRSLALDYADVIYDRQIAAEKHQSFADYPALTTDESVEYYDEAHDYFLEAIVELESDKYGLLDSVDDTVDWKNFGWDDLEDIPLTFQKKWKSIVKKYKEEYGGNSFIDAYNERIKSGNVTKVDPSTYIFRK